MSVTHINPESRVGPFSWWTIQLRYLSSRSQGSPARMSGGGQRTRTRELT
ncbi:MAG TPA: hypothetical protein VE027_06700 [Acidimicrobiia bacterium]|nr:hypothetical protein [Acidimicrobiia bacterium]